MVSLTTEQNERMVPTDEQLVQETLDFEMTPEHQRFLEEGEQILVFWSRLKDLILTGVKKARAVGREEQKVIDADRCNEIAWQYSEQGLRDHRYVAEQCEIAILRKEDPERSEGLTDTDERSESGKEPL